MTNFEIFHNNLTISIEKFTSFCEKENKEFWSINNINIKHAVERDLYFGFMNRLEFFYNIYLTKKMPNNLHTFQEMVLLLLLKQDIKPLKINSQLHTLPFSNFVIKKKKIMFIVVRVHHLKHIESLIQSLEKNSYSIACRETNTAVIKYIISKGYNYTLIQEPKKKKFILPEHLKQLKPAQYLETFYNTIIKYKPSTIITTEGCHIDDELSCKIGNMLNLQTICIQHGYAPENSTLFRNMNYKYLISWGSFFTRELQQNNPNSKVLSIGNTNIDTKTIRKKEVKVISFFLQMVRSYLTKQDYKNFLILIAKIAKLQPQIQIIVREHPLNPLSQKELYKFKKFNNIIFMNPNKFTTQEVLDRSDIAVSISSTSIVEAIALGALPIYINKETIFNKVCKESTALKYKSFKKALYKMNLLCNNKYDFNKKQSRILKNQKKFFVNNKISTLKSLKELL